MRRSEKEEIFWSEFFLKEEGFLYVEVVNGKWGGGVCGVGIYCGSGGCIGECSCDCGCFGEVVF